MSTVFKHPINRPLRLALRVNKLVAEDIVSEKKIEPVWVPGYIFVDYVRNSQGYPVHWMGEKFLVIRHDSPNSKPFPVLEGNLRIHH